MTASDPTMAHISRRMLSAKAEQFTESVIREMTRLALKHNAVNLSQGFPDFAAPEEIKEAARQAISNNINQFTVSVQAPDGPLARLNQSVEQISAGISQETLPKINAITNDARSSLRAINRTTDALNERPQSLLFGKAAPAPGPGEPGFVAPK